MTTQWPPEIPGIDYYYHDDATAIVCGDCLDVLPKMAPGSVDLVLTDPPYGHNNNNGDLISRREAALGHEAVPQREWRPIANDGPEANEIVQQLFAESKRLLKPGCCCCCCGGGGGPDPQFARWALWLGQYLQFKQMVVWDKGPMGMGWHYRRSYETILVAEKPGAPIRWRGGNAVENIIRPNAKGIRKIIPSKDQHPTEKPTGLKACFVRWHTDPGDLILDPFMGSGTTLVAAKQLGRRAIGIELEPKYCDIAVQRLAQEVLAL